MCVAHVAHVCVLNCRLSVENGFTCSKPGSRTALRSLAFFFFDPGLRHGLLTLYGRGGQGLHWCKVAKLPDHESAAAAQGSAHDEAEAAARTRAVQVPAPTAAVSCTCALACACGSALPCISNTLSHACHACHACHQCLQSLSRPTRTRKCTHANTRRCMPLRRTRARACTRPHISACVPTNVCTYVCLRVYTEREASARASRPRGTGSVGDSVGEGGAEHKRAHALQRLCVLYRTISALTSHQFHSLCVCAKP
jgi:hypothetical protein